MAAFDAIAISELLLQEMKVVHQETGVIVLLSSNLVFVDRVLKGLSGGAFTCDEYLSVLKCLRHACAGNFPNAKLLTELQVPGAVLDFLSKSYAAYLDEKDYLNNNTTPSHNAPRSETPSDAQLKTLLTLTTQVLANFSACKDTSCSSAATPLTVNTLWSLGGVDVFSSLVNMAASLSAQGALAATFAALYSCLLSAELGASAQVAASRQLCCQLALSVLDLQYAELSSKGGCGGGGSALSAATSAPPSVEWFQLLVLQLLKEGQAVRALQSVKRSEQMLAGLAAAHAECFSVTMTHEEVIFLCALDSCLDDHSSLAGAVQGEAGQAALLGLLRHVAALMTPRPGMTSAWYPGVVPVEASSVAVDEEFAVYLTAGRPAPPSGSPAEQDVQLDIDSLATPAASVCVNILAKLAALSNAALGECAALSHGQMSRALTLGEALKQALLEAGVLNICCSCLTGLHKIKSDKNSLLAGQKKTPLSATEQSAAEYSSEVARACLQVAMNLSFRCREAQDYCRMIGGFTVILSYCSTDFDSPLSREWALMCVRNLCENNEENQQFVSSMQLRGVLRDELLEQQGIRVEVDPSRGKFSFTHTEEKKQPK